MEDLGGADGGSTMTYAGPEGDGTEWLLHVLFERMTTMNMCLCEIHESSGMA